MPATYNRAMGSMVPRGRPLLLFALLLLLAIVGPWGGLACARAQTTPASPPLGAIPAEASGPAIDPAAATRAYLATIPAAARASSDAYFEGGYWLLLWNALFTAGVCLLLLASGWSAAWRGWATRLVRWRAAQVALYAMIFVVATTVLGFPFTVYQNYFREHQYGMATQDFGSWGSEWAIGLMVQVIITALFLPALYAVFRRAPRTWWVWGSGVTILFLAFGIVVAPVFIAPLFNRYQPLADPALREPILALARANQIPVDHVNEFDASRQTTRVSANVAGAFGVARINLNDNLIKRCSLPEIRHVMAHEMGHYVLNHIYKLLLEFAVLLLLLATLTRVLFEAALHRWGGRWGVRGIADPAGFPLLVLILTVLGLLFTPVFNGIVRETEVEADAFGLNASREPDGFAQASIKLGQYRKMDPGPVEEFVFFDHPSGRARIRMAMDWKAAHLPAGP